MGVAGTTHPAAAIHTDVPSARFTGCPVYNGLLVLVVKALPLGDAVQLTFVGGCGKQEGQVEMLSEVEGLCEQQRSVGRGRKQAHTCVHTHTGRGSPTPSHPQWLKIPPPSQRERIFSMKWIHLWELSRGKILELGKS